jgi:hypothetical protein
MENKTLMTDFYELTMAQTYFDQDKKDEYVYFDIFFRKNPYNGGYTISGGLDNIIDYINNFHFEPNEIEYLKGLGNFSDDFLEYLKDIKFIVLMVSEDVLLNRDKERPEDCQMNERCIVLLNSFKRHNYDSKYIIDTSYISISDTINIIENEDRFLI